MPSMSPTVAERLRELGVRGVLISAAEQGAIADLVCAMPECLCPEELGGRGYFEPKTQVLSVTSRQVVYDAEDWMPTSDHYPVLKKDGGHRTVANVRLAHRLCNRVDYSKAIGRPFEKDLARVEAARREALRRMTRRD